MEGWMGGWMDVWMDEQMTAKANWNRVKNTTILFLNSF